MSKINKNIILVVVLVLIAGTIWYLESHKASHGNDTTAVQAISLNNTDSAENNLQDTATSTVATSSVKQSLSQTRVMSIQAKAKIYPSAVELIPGGKFINTDPFTLRSLIGKKVILIDFWTYSCINCQRTIPYLNAWYEKYKDKGLVIVGVHTPEFDFEKEYANVLKGVQDLGIKYPVMQDNNFATWNAYQNRFWPREYLIDIDGFVVHDKIGEGGYAESEHVIQKALQERDRVLNINSNINTSVSNPVNAISLDQAKVASPETYFGSARNEYLANGTSGVVSPQTLVFPTNISSNKLYLDGAWNFTPEYAESTQATSKIIFKYNSKNVYFVASSDTGVTLNILKDGKPVGQVNVKDNKLYKLIEGSDYGEHTLEIDVQGSGLHAFTFTFG
jgi:thiol-disulfide isomerase/thioredoxin